MKLIELEEEEEGPKIIRGNVLVPAEVTHLDYYDTIIGWSFSCSDTKITSLEGSPIKVGRDFFCEHTKVSSLKGCPRNIGGEFHCQNTRIKSLHNIHKHIDRIGKWIYIPNVRSHILGLIKIRDLEFVSVMGNSTHNKKLIDALYIINVNLLRDKNIHKVQEEMLEAGLAEYALL